MKFEDAAEVSQACWTMKQADYPRGTNRARINELFNGHPPYTDAEVDENNIAVNVNFLESTRLAHDARSQFNNAFTKPGNYFTARTDMGPLHKRGKYGAIVTKEMNRIMKRSLPYFECFRSKFALDVLHGVGPATWANDDVWCPDPAGIEDILVPGNTLVTLKNLSMFAVYRSFSAPELLKIKRTPNLPAGWNMDLVDKCLKWIDTEAVNLLGSNWPEIWAPEKLSERIKSDGGLYVADQIPTIECFDFYYLDGDDADMGWRRRIVLDSWAVSEAANHGPSRKKGDVYRNDGEFLFSSEDRKVADNHRQIISFQFADLSAVAPFRFHSVRSLGFLLYAVCHLQNRLRCRFNEAVFEALMMYFRVKTMDDAQRVLKLEMVNRGFIEDGIQPVPAAERYQVNAPLVQFGIQQNQQIITENSSSYVQQPNYSQGGVEKTKFQVMAETNSMTSLVSAALNQAYTYQTFEYMEIARRFFKPLSTDAEVKKFRAAVLQQGVPEKMLQADYWDYEPERVMGAGNKTLEMTIAQQLMEWRPMFDPEPQRDILRDAVLAITDDPARAETLVPPTPVKITDSVHDAQLAAGTLLQGLPVAPKTGVNHIEYIEVLLGTAEFKIQQINGSGKVPTPEQLMGLDNLIKNIVEHITILAQDERERQRVKQYGDRVGKAMNELRAFAQRLDEQMQQEQQAQGQLPPEQMAKVQVEQMKGQQKIQQMKLSHAERTAERQVQFEMEEQRRQQEHQFDMQRQAAQLQAEIMGDKVRLAADLEAKDAETEQQIRLAKAEAAAKPKPSSNE